MFDEESDELDFDSTDLFEPDPEEELFLQRIEEDVAESRIGVMRPRPTIAPAEVYGAALARMFNARRGARDD